MGTALTGQTKASTYDALLKITDNGPVGGTEKVVTDGLGNDSALTLGSNGFSSTGTITAAGLITGGAGVTFSGPDDTNSQLCRSTGATKNPGLFVKAEEATGDVTISASGSTSGYALVMDAGGTEAGRFTTTGLNGCAIGATTPAAGAFTTLTASSTATLNTLASSGATITGGTVNGTVIGGVTPAAGTFTALSATSITAPFVKQSGGNVRVSSGFDKSADTALSDVTGLSVSLAAGETYTFDAALFCSQTSTGGYVVGVGGTATTANIYGAIVYNYGFGSIQNDVINTLPGGSALGGAGTAYQVTVKGTITVINAGTLTITFAQASANGVSTVKRGSYLHVTQY